MTIMTTRRQRSETFTVRDGHLIRKVVPLTRRVSQSETGREATTRQRRERRVKGEPYEHRCPIDAFDRIAQAIDELGDEGFTLETLFYREDVPWTQVAVALAFLKERGIIDTRNRRNHAATTTGVHLDAMTEYHALAAGV